ncbi:hypothetical protein ZWY2020_011257 [Hordeum vulgare]|nr:hypothetical protein ZWY2020_011257 [Hordeum vulgare]
MPGRVHRGRTSKTHGSSTNPKVAPLLLVLLLLLLVHRTAADERQLLMQIKHTWGDPPVLAAWSNGSESGDHCSWPYVTCDAPSGRVTGLSLANTKVAGPFPAAIGGLSGLTSLNLFNNSLTGAFPTSVYRCASLRHLDLSYNYFHGELPASIGRALGQNLTSLMLNGDCFTGAIPTSLSSYGTCRRSSWTTTTSPAPSRQSSAT